MNKLIVYSNGSEVIVTTLENQADTVTEYFHDTGRNIIEYDRQVFTSAVHIELGSLITG